MQGGQETYDAAVTDRAVSKSVCRNRTGHSSAPAYERADREDGKGGSSYVQGNQGLDGRRKKRGSKRGKKRRKDLYYQKNDRGGNGRTFHTEDNAVYEDGVCGCRKMR